MKKVICFGEILWDIFPNHQVLGGAPFNVAQRLRSFGIASFLLSCIGNDALGKQLLEELDLLNFPQEGVQKSDQYATGQVQVTLDGHGGASYSIESPAAWDYIQMTPENIRAVRDADMLIFGSLACRNNRSKTTLFQLLKEASFKVFDVNIRPPYNDLNLLKELMFQADLIKFNDEELIDISSLVGCKEEKLEDRMHWIAQHTQTPQICVTKGAEGALLLSDGKLFSQSGFAVEVIDTVGAGDSFLATIIEGILQGRRPQECLQRACAMGALVAASTGANPNISTSDFEMFMFNRLL